jgi:type I restriction enzyme S subunit
MASVKDLTRFGVDLSQARLIPIDDFNALVKQGCKPEVGDVLIAKDGNSALDTVCNVDHPLDAVMLSSVAILRPNSDKLDSHYLKHYLASPDVIAYLKTNFISGAAIPRVVLKDFKKAEIRVPPLQTQRAIAIALDSLDDRIALLRETNATLEAIAQALFKSWFVDFDPVRAKQQGRAPEGMDETVAAFFPDSFEESELGLVPKGWRVGSLGNELKIAYGKNLPTTRLLASGFPVYGGNGQIGFFDKYLYESRQVLIACRGAASGKVNQSSPKAFVTNNSLVLESNDSTLLPFGYLKGYMLGSDLIPFVTGSAQPQVTIDNLKVFKLLIPSIGPLKSFESFSSALEDRIEENDQQAQTLVTLRDTLLPRLISGQLRLPEADAPILETAP